MSENSELLRTIGTRIHALRLSKGVSPEKIKEAAGINHWRLTRIENGTSEITVPQLFAVAKLFCVTTAVLTGEEKLSAFIERVEAAKTGAP